MFNIEKKIIKICSKVICDDTDLKSINLLVQKNIDWGFLLYLILHHRITPIVYDNLTKANALEYVEKYVRRAMKTECLRIAEKNNILFEEIKIINDCFLNYDLKAVNIKGAVIAQRIYGNLSYREFTDIDYLVDKKDITKLTECLISLNYVQGHYNFSTNSITAYSRKEIIERLINSHESAEFVKLIDNKYFSSIIVDLNHNIIWNEFYKTTDIGKVINFTSEKVFCNINGMRGYNLIIEDEFIQLCCHLYSEAVYFCFDPFWWRDKTDINIIKLCDIYMLIQQNLINWNNVLCKVDVMGLNEPICYALDCVSEFYNELNLPFDVHKFFKYNENKQELINKYFNKFYKAKYWNCSFEDRIFNINRKVNEIKKDTITVSSNYIKRC